MNDPIPADHPLVAADRRHMIHPLHFATDHANPKIFVSARGSVLRTADGREYIDGLSSMWNVNIGHGRKELATAAAAQMETLDYASAYAGIAECFIELAYFFGMEPKQAFAEAEAAAIILALAAGEVSEDSLARWIRDNWPKARRGSSIPAICQ